MGIVFPTFSENGSECLMYYQDDKTETNHFTKINLNSNKRVLDAILGDSVDGVQGVCPGPDGDLLDVGDEGQGPMNSGMRDL